MVPRLCATLAVFALLSSLVPSLAAQVPVGFPPPRTPTGNPWTADKALLGKALFWDEQLSATGTVACGTCHIFSAGGTDPRSVGNPDAIHPGFDRIFGTDDDVVGSPGVVRNQHSGRYLRDSTFGLEPQVTGRKAPSVVNAAYHRSLFWDGRAATTPFRDPITGALTLGQNSALESVAAAPPTDSIEMGHETRTWTEIESKLTASLPLALATNLPPDVAAFVAGARYPDLFDRAFGTPDVTASRTAMALASYMRTLIADQSPFDRVLEGTATLAPAEANGRAIFDANCAICHEDLSPFSHFNGPNVAVFEFSNTGLRPFFEDQGAGGGQFKIPFLRNVALRAPFFHNGQADTLMEVVEFYDRGGDFANLRSTFIQPLNLTAQERSDLVAFLMTLTDPRVAQELPPFDRPTLFSENPGRQTTRFGTGTAGSGGLVPTALVMEPAYVGNSRFTLGVDQARSRSLAFLLLDGVPNPVGTTVQGIQLHLAQSPAFAVITAPSLTTGLGSGTGHVTMTLQVPNAPGLRGLVQYGQWAILDPGAPARVAASEGFAIPIF